MDACLVQIWWFQLKSVTNYAENRKFMDGQTNGQMQATAKIPLQPERPRGKNLKKKLHPNLELLFQVVNLTISIRIVSGD